jgi:hypothetical protein
MNEKIAEFCRLLQFPEVQEVLKDIIRTSLVESNVFTRLNLIEENLGSDEYHCIGRDLDYEKGISEYDEEREPLPTVKQQILAVYKAIDSFDKPNEQVIITGNMTEIRARLFKERIVSVNYRHGKKFMLTPEIKRFLLNEIHEDYRTTDKGAKQAAHDVMKKALEMFPDELKAGTASNGVKFIEYIEKAYY